MLGVSLKDWPIVECYVSAAPGSLMRSAELWKIGKFRVSRRDCELYSIQVTSAGAWGRIRVYNGAGRLIFHLPSTVTGSFWLSAGCEGGLIVDLASMSTAPTVNVNFREPDLEVI